MNKLQKTIISIYFIMFAIGIVTIFVGDGGITIFLTLLIGTPLAGVLLYINK